MKKYFKAFPKDLRDWDYVIIIIVESLSGLKFDVIFYLAENPSKIEEQNSIFPSSPFCL